MREFFAITLGLWMVGWVYYGILAFRDGGSMSEIEALSAFIIVTLCWGFIGVLLTPAPVKEVKDEEEQDIKKTS